VRLYTEEPYEWNSSSTGLWGERRVTGASTRKLTTKAEPIFCKFKVLGGFCVSSSLALYFEKENK